ncbi:MAG: hypothetical protein U0805_04795 [Pirellulales bacterium]
MDAFARAFDAPIDSREHRDLEENGWFAGTPVTLRFYFGRLIQENLFRATDDEVVRKFVGYIGKRVSPQGAELLRYGQGWDVAELLLRHYFECATLGKSTRNPREVSAIEAFLANQKLSDIELAQLANTTEKQLARMSTLALARSLPLNKSLSDKSDCT